MKKLALMTVLMRVILDNGYFLGHPVGLLIIYDYTQ